MFESCSRQTEPLLSGLCMDIRDGHNALGGNGDRKLGDDSKILDSLMRAD